MRILIEEYQYDVAKVKDILHGEKTKPKPIFLFCHLEYAPIDNQSKR